MGEIRGEKAWEFGISRCELEKAMAFHSSTLTWKISWMEEPGGLQSLGLLKVWHGCVTSLSLFTFMHWRRKWQPTPVFLPWESQGWGSLVVYRVRHDWSDLAATAAGGINSTLDDVEKCTCNLEDRVVESTQSQQQKRILKNEDSLKTSGTIVSCTINCDIKITAWEKWEKEAEIFPNLRKEIDTQIQETQRVSNKMNHRDLQHDTL